MADQFRITGWIDEPAETWATSTHGTVGRTD